MGSHALDRMGGRPEAGRGFPTGNGTVTDAPYFSNVVRRPHLRDSRRRMILPPLTGRV